MVIISFKYLHSQHVLNSNSNQLLYQLLYYTTDSYNDAGDPLLSVSISGMFIDPYMQAWIKKIAHTESPYKLKLNFIGLTRDDAVPLGIALSSSTRAIKLSIPLDRNHLTPDIIEKMSPNLNIFMINGQINPNLKKMLDDLRLFVQHIEDPPSSEKDSMLRQYKKFSHIFHSTCSQFGLASSEELHYLKEKIELYISYNYSRLRGISKTQDPLQDGINQRVRYNLPPEISAHITSWLDYVTDKRKELKLNASIR